ncbi:GntR family transcriptional regulator [Aestuariicoccus sp. MJ-SS9]|uniref:GntR family transcriptional regulator n=1 Tax=Aestuariicoccus sp. MJ-SS9 TaxID=3079855 RepID=UPI0029136872|nr:GntR family transcriptional regulator [Aestuariicoccus sp. MJ-SS9]MDU8911651.1 GntR family transcriptional regulator [Aestuariicoccus sp. MJ-SS9]
MKTRRSDHPRRRVDRRGKQAISRVPLHEQVAGEIRSMIVAGDLAPGEKVRVSELAEELDVSLTPMREALKILDKENLVELTTNRGARVSEITVEGTRSLFEVISRLESLAAELAAERITADELAVLEDLHARMRDCHETGDLPGYFDLNRQIHDLVVEAAKNPDLTRVRTSLAFHVERARFLSVGTTPHRDRSMADHEALMQALRERDAKAARDIWQTHLERAGNETCRLVAQWKEDAGATAAQ